MWLLVLLPPAGIAAGCDAGAAAAPPDQLLRVHVAPIPERFNTELFTKVEKLYNHMDFQPPLSPELPFGGRIPACAAVECELACCQHADLP